MSGSRLLFRWRNAIVASDLIPSRRHVALTLALHMNRDGGSCFPSLGLLADETGLSKSTVALALNDLEAFAWVKRNRSPLIGRPAKRDKFKSPVTRYTPTIPGEEESDCRTVLEEEVSDGRMLPDKEVSDGRTESVRSPDEKSPTVGHEYFISNSGSASGLPDGDALGGTPPDSLTAEQRKEQVERIKAWAANIGKEVVA